MYFCRKSLAVALILAAPTTATAATVTYNGTSYEIVSGPASVLSAEVGQTVTQSFAGRVFLSEGQDITNPGTTADSLPVFQAAYDAAIANGDTDFITEIYGGASFSYPGATNGSFTVGSAGPYHQASAVTYAEVNLQTYAFYDITFTPTAATPTQTSAFMSHTYYVDSYDVDPFGDATTYDSGLYNDFNFFEFNVLPTTGTSVTPVPVPGSAAFLALGLMGFAVAKRKKS